MLQLDLKRKGDIDLLFKDLEKKNTYTPRQKVERLILRDLLRLDWKISFGDNKIIVDPPKNYNKDIIRQSMSHRRKEYIDVHADWIKKNIEFARANLANGEDVLKSKIKPIIEVCETPKQHDLFRMYRYYWSSAYSEYVGRRIKLIIRDAGLPNKPVIGIAALGSSIIHIPDRDNWVGWDKNQRTKNLIYAMDAYVIGALPPYNYLLGGKLVSYILASSEVRKIYKKKYLNKITLIDKKKASELVCIFTTSLYGKSAQYDRMKYKSKLLYIPIGETRGFGTLHLSGETLRAMMELLKSKGISVTNKFGDGPSWSMRVIRTVGDILKFDSNFLLTHSFKRGIYAVPLASNFREFLNGKDKKPKYYDRSLKNIVSFWKKRWLKNRRQNPEIIARVLNFKTSDFNIEV